LPVTINYLLGTIEHFIEIAGFIVENHFIWWFAIDSEDLI